MESTLMDYMPLNPAAVMPARLVMNALYDAAFACAG
jgi:hypothetical protein